MKIQQKRSLRQKLIGGLAGLVLSAGCVTSGSVGAFVGSHNPTSQRNPGTIIFDSSIETGIRGRAKTKSKVEVEVAYSGHKTNWTDGFENDDLEANDLSVSASYPLFSNEKFSVNAGAGVVSRSEKKDITIIGWPGHDIHNTSSTGWKAGVEARYQPHKNVSVEAGLDFHGFGDGSYEKSGTTLSLGASYNF
jgi:opacity protein-like surface antigen